MRLSVPIQEAANFLSLLQGDGATELISNYGQRWLSQTLQRVKKRANVIRLIMLIFLVMSLMLLVLPLWIFSLLVTTAWVTFKQNEDIYVSRKY